MPDVLYYLVPSETDARVLLMLNMVTPDDPINDEDGTASVS